MTTVTVRCPHCGFEAKLVRDAVGSLNFPLDDDIAQSCEYLIDQKARGAIHDWACPHLKDEVDRIFRPVTGEPQKHGVTMTPELEERIRRRAMEIWKEEGCPEGRSREHWEQAERELTGDRDGEGQAGEAQDKLRDELPR